MRDLRKIYHELWDGLRAQPLQVCGILLSTAVVTHTLSLWLLGKELDPWGWVLRAFLLGLGLAGLAHSGNWVNLQEGSLLMQWLKKR